MKFLKSSLLVAVLSSSFAFTESTQAATDIYLKLSTIAGDSLSNTHKDEIDVLSYSQSVQRPVTNSTNVNNTHTNKVSCGQISIQKYLDKSSPFLIGAVFSGRHIPSGQISFDKAADGPGVIVDYYQIILNDITVTSVQQSNSNASAVVETVTLNAAKIEVLYRPQQPDGAYGAAEKFNIDCATERAY
jgi:type VI secretion system secreted protein Hcp